MPPRADLLFDCSDISSTLLQNSAAVPVIKTESSLILFFEEVD